MRWFIVILFLKAAVWSASIDTNLYEGTDKEAYYLTIAERIETEAKSGLTSEETIKEERLQLARVRSAAAQVPKIERYDLTALADGANTLHGYYGAINAGASLRLRMEQRRKMLRDLSSKTAFLKQSIERIVKEEKPRLLSYQLQYAYYKLQQKNLEARVDLLQTHGQEVMDLLVKHLALLQCDVHKTVDEALARSTAALEQALQQKVALQISLEKAMIEGSGKSAPLQQKINAAETQYQQALTAKIGAEVQQSLCMLKQKRNKAFFARLEEIQTLSENLSKEERPRYEQILAILRELAKEVFGSTKLFIGDTQHESMAALTKIKETFTAPLFVYNEQPISLLSLLKALIWVILGFFLGVLYKRWIARVARRWPDMSQMSIRLASNIGYYLIVIITFIIAIGSIGIDMTSISLIAGALSIGIGFGLQTVVSNLIAGIILMFERTIRIGDTIEISDMLRGRVTDMRIRSTTIKTFDNIDIVVPNSSFIQNNVINWTLDDPTRRLHIPFGVAYGTEVERVKKVILEELEKSALTYIKDNSEKKPEVWMVAMNSSSVDFELLVWVEWASKLRPNSLRSDFLILIYNALYKHGIQIPFPQLDLYVKQLPADTLK
ncbi:mechanosensitive ion channel domain-containing protein [Sulfurimonas sp. HSL3-7]|uniref:mechanosensitive ion channel family protein n=1 Tax=Sulfonitrofixus jiaomeiensis TaxID=3131938 RepID=UPI0031F7B668